MPDVFLEIKVTLYEITCFLKNEALSIIKSGSQFISEYLNELKLPVTAVLHELKSLPVNLILTITVGVMLSVGANSLPVLPPTFIYESNTSDNLAAYSVDASSLSESSVINDFTLKISDMLSHDNSLPITELQEAWLSQNNKTSNKVIVAILDTGIDTDHEDLKGLVIANADFTGSSPFDVYGHGTHIAGIIAAVDNDIGINGIAPGCKLLNAKVADDIGCCQSSNLARGIIWAVDNGANVINISIEIAEPSLELVEAVDYAWNSGAVIIAAAGNYTGNSTVYPAGYPNCIAVSSSPEVDSLAFLNSTDQGINLAAPGFNIYSSLPDDSYGYKSGSSFATAYASGISALLFNVVVDTDGNGRLNDEVAAALETGLISNSSVIVN